MEKSRKTKVLQASCAEDEVSQQISDTVSDAVTQYNCLNMRCLKKQNSRDTFFRLQTSVIIITKVALGRRGGHILIHALPCTVTAGLASPTALVSNLNMDGQGQPVRFS